MFSSRRAAQRLCGGCALAQGCLPAAALHPSRPLLLRAKTLAGVTPQNAAASLHGRDGAGDDSGAGDAGRGCHRAVGGDRDADTQGNNAHGALVEGGASTYPVSVVHAHTAASQATAALKSLLGHSRLSSSAVAADTDGADRFSNAEAPATYERIPDADTVGSDVAGSADGDAVEGDGVSNGEEELLECAEAFADEVEAMGVERAATVTASKAAPPLHGAASQKQNRTEREQPAKPVATPYSAGEPLNLQGVRYWGSIASAMRSTAEARRFLSPFWASRRAFEDAGATVTVEEEEGVLVCTTTSAVVRLFNLEQTTLAAEYRAATVTEVIARLRLARDRDGTSSFRRGFDANAKLLDLAGGHFSFALATSIAASPHFPRLRAQSPYWLSERDVQAIGATVRPEEVGCCTLVPLSSSEPWWQSPAATAADAELSYDARAGAAATSVPGEEASTDTARSIVRYYNVAQLDDRERFARLNPLRDRLVRCLNYRGSRYNPCTTWLMWEYCARYHFPLTDTPGIVFLTMEKIFQLGGRVVQTKRYPIPRTHAGRGDGTAADSRGSSIRSAAAASVSMTPPSSSAATPDLEKLGAIRHGELGVVPACGSEDTSTCNGHGARGGTDGTSSTAADVGVVPPLFTMVIHNEVVSLCNAMQTDIADVVLARAGELRKSRYWKRWV
ncbi:conserved hypothetical protein [Leishmania infantum JPCM5]|uniref:Trypanosoma Tc-38 (p38) protein domain-containing protein n=2 Tax=Leishmania infantum TaxID=5671 RepID=E9AGN3_LEIIN|nr:conserved hypothetical protein [Leishmania infantum JPCM5]CAC9475040.1 hypothetical_protein_-_conserved [Leishmania infantum]CBZ08542.1 conserved hypothetical protein [Leishmania infantum JPCM5]SUZ40648.1 hypothetical_protein_-_conserved [Leishmania infantum]|eukprot:XP_003392384.1 conserved hypothetical protein [Leishmania infantum JPCM5]